MEIEIITSGEEFSVQRRGSSRANTQKSKVISLAKETLSKEWLDFVSSVSDVFSKLELDGDLIVDEINISVGISAEGKFQLFAGASVGANAGITIKLKRNDQE